MSRMPNRTLLALPVLLLASTARSAASQSAPPQSAPPLQLRWELVGDSLTNDGGSSRVLFTLTNRDTKPLPKSGWAIYFSALHSAQPGSAGAGCEIQYARDSGVRDIAVSDLPPVFPTPVQVTRRAGEVRLTAMPAITAPAELTSEAQFAAEYLRPYVGSGKGSVALRLEVGPVEGQS